MGNLAKRIFPLILTLLICFTQYGFASFRNPPNSVVKEALELQIELTHRSLEKFLDLGDESVDVLRVKVDSRSYIPDAKRKLVSVSGSLNCKFPGESVQRTRPFVLFLERGEKGQSWRLANPVLSKNGLDKEWMTYPLPIKPKG